MLKMSVANIYAKISVRIKDILDLIVLCCRLFNNSWPQSRNQIRLYICWISPTLVAVTRYSFCICNERLMGPLCPNIISMRVEHCVSMSRLQSLWLAWNWAARKVYNIFTDYFFACAARGGATRHSNLAQFFPVISLPNFLKVLFFKWAIHTLF